MSGEHPDFDMSESETHQTSDDLTDATGNIAYGLNQSGNTDATGNPFRVEIAQSSNDAAGNNANDREAGGWIVKNEAETESIEYIPTEEEIRNVLEVELKIGPYTESRKCLNADGLYLLEVRVPGEEDGEIIEYSYIRKGHYPEGEAGNTRIDRWFYQDGDIIGGDGPVAELIDGQWKIIS